MGFEEILKTKELKSLERCYSFRTWKIIGIKHFRPNILKIRDYVIQVHLVKSRNWVDNPGSENLI